MTLNTKNLSVLSYANGFTLWHLATSDTLAYVDTVGYLNSVATMVRKKDMLFISASDGTGLFCVSSNINGVVGLNNTMAVTETDTD